ncbi:MAG: hypothetical protein IT520_09405 [Burkholderiales bacterium]|nr:hypothetical protein [Burkholderiales bacterium]
MASLRRVFGASVVALVVLVAAFGSDALAATRYWSLDGVQTLAVGLVDVVEFYHAGLDHYSITGDPGEVQVLDLGTIAGWTRTGQVFQAYAIGSSPGAATNPVCRDFGVPVPGISSHLHSANAVECYQVYVLFGTVWQIESDNVFQIDVPDSVGGCPGGTIPVYRLFNSQADANHRYTTSTTVRAQMEAAGWVREGYGPGGVVFCAIGP